MQKEDFSVNHVRRQDRNITDEEWIQEYLLKAPYGFLATSIDDLPFINSNLFVYDEKYRQIYMHTARLVRTRSNLEGDRLICFSVAAMGRLLPADEALEFSLEYTGVTIFGKGRVVKDPREAERALRMLLDKYFPHLKSGQDYRAITPDEIKRTAVFRLEIKRRCAKRKAVEPNFPGAFFYQDL
jgi:nitroimidazol reductase NimA-like FMN-containing flavoprotein (pyridoxamine 5'-phosphate oxidase superfamily)